MDVWILFRNKADLIGVFSLVPNQEPSPGSGDGP